MDTLDLCWKDRDSHIRDRNHGSKEENIILDLNMTTYRVLSTPLWSNNLQGDEFKEYGFIEKISGETLSEIQQRSGNGYLPWNSGTLGMKDYLDKLYRDKKEKCEIYYASFMNSLAGSSGM